MTAGAIALGGAPQVIGLNEETQAALDEMWRQWTAKRSRNALRLLYLDSKNALNDLGIALPPSLRNLNAAMDWAPKAVHGLAQRVVWEGVTAPGDSQDPFELRELLRDNMFPLEFGQAAVDSMGQSVAFVSTSPGDVRDGEPAVLTQFHSALWSTGIWDRRRRSLSSGLVITDADANGQPTGFVVLTRSEYLVCVKGAGQWYLADAIPHKLRRVPMEPLPSQPSLSRPFGRSRISRPVMSIVDRAVSNAVRMEVSSELNASPKLLLLGASPEAFKDHDGNQVPLWTWFLSRLNVLERDDEGEVPTLEKIAASSPEPYLAIHRQLVQDFAGATGIPPASLGVVSENPSSSQAIREVREDLIVAAETWCDVAEVFLNRTYQNMVMIRDNIGPDQLTRDLRDVSTKWRNPLRPSIASQSDAMVKQISAIPWLAETTVALEELGYSPEQITRLLSDKARAQGALRLTALLEASRGTAPAEADAAPEGDEAKDLKDRADSMGTLIRAGVKPESAAAKAGLTGLTFTGLTPVSLREPGSGDDHSQ